MLGAALERADPDRVRVRFDVAQARRQNFGEPDPKKELSGFKMRRDDQGETRIILIAAPYLSARKEFRSQFLAGE